MSTNRIAVVIDEEPHYSETVASALRLQGFEVDQFFDATAALNAFQLDTEKYGDSLIFIDMALEPGEDDTIFSAAATKNYATTGLILAKEIIENNIVPENKRQNMILYSAHIMTQHWKKIENFCSLNNTRCWQKRVDADLQEILDLSLSFIE